MEAKEKWEKLSEDRRKRLLERHRDTNMYDDWWDGVYEAFKEDMGAIGVYVGAIYFSGFWSQGDGACFEGYITDWVKFLTALDKPETARILADLGDLGGCTEVSLAWRHSGRSYHEHCITFIVGLAIDNPYDEMEQPLRHAAWEAIHGANGPLAPLEEEFIEFLRGKMRTLYRQLEKEYEYLTSDEEVTTYVLDCCEDEIDTALEEQGEEEIDSV